MDTSHGFVLASYGAETTERQIEVYHECTRARSLLVILDIQ
jgi:hypothetical protein